MKKIISVAAASAILLGTMAVSAEAMPAAPVAADQMPGVTFVAGGCGPGWHRGPWGGCRRNWGWHRPMYRHCWWRHTPWGPRRVCRW